MKEIVKPTPSKCSKCGKAMDTLEIPYEITLRVYGNPAYPSFWLCHECGYELRKVAENGLH
jgi:C4-type Zn-finger protein